MIRTTRRLVAAVLVASVAAVNCGGSDSGPGGAAGQGGGAVAGAAGQGGGAVAGAAGQGGGAVADAGPSALELAELALPSGGIVDFDLLTARHIEDPESGEQTPIGWGPKTLPSQEQRDAAEALIRRLAALLPNSARNVANSGPYTAGDVNVLNALLTLDASPLDLLTGTNLAPRAASALAAFEAGVVADRSSPGAPVYLPGLPAGSSDGQLGQYISQNGTDPQGVVGLVNNIVKLALQSGFEEQLRAY